MDVDTTCSGLLPIFPGREEEAAVYAAPGDLLWTRGELRRRAIAWANKLERPVPSLIFLFCRNEPEILAALYGAIAAGHAVALLDADAPAATTERLRATFRPEVIISGEGLVERSTVLSLAADSIAGGLAVLLSTSGTTGSSKFVRLAARNLVANADQIVAALDMTPADVGIAHLPLHYSYGLSVVTSHLRVGGAVHLWPGSVTVPEFWEAARASGATQFPGVPFHYNFLARGDLATLLPQSLRTCTQAGGALPARLQTRMHQMLSAIGGGFFVMYGQTEAAPRMTTLPHHRLSHKIGSVGPALPGGKLSVIDDEGLTLAAGQTGHIVYEGPNVMLGYAERRSDLAMGNVMAGRLETGDIGRLDAEGFLTLTGRSKRFAKLHGLRLSLDEIEARFADVAEIAAVERGDKILLFTAAPDAIAALTPAVAAEYKLPAASFGVRLVDALPRKASGKIDYPILERAP